MTFVLMQPGSFMMGSPADQLKMRDGETQHTVTISKIFYIQTTTVTQGQWTKVMDPNPSHFRNRGDGYPVEQVSWDDVQNFIRALKGMAGSERYRLPTEAEWEYAARAGTTSAYSFGDHAVRSLSLFSNEDTLGDYAWYKKNAGSETHAVGQKRPNGWGLYDMHGNVSEWVQDLYSDYLAESVTDPRGPTVGQYGPYRVHRGDCWDVSAEFCRCAYRNYSNPDRRSSKIGFRLAIA